MFLGKKSGKILTAHYQDPSGRQVRYAHSGGARGLPAVLFIHGAPGNLYDFRDFLSDNRLRNKAALFAADRPGYGKSECRKTADSLQAQAAALHPLLKKMRQHSKTLVLGHSYGGTLAARLTMDYPQLIDHLVLVAAALDPENEKMFWFNRPLNSRLLRPLLPPPLRRANDEKLAHVKETKKMLPHWHKIRTPVTLIHGTKDRIVPLENAYFAKKMLQNAPLNFRIHRNANHFILWQRTELIKSTILKILSSR